MSMKILFTDLILQDNQHSKRFPTILGTAIALYILLMIVTFPRMYTSLDESANFGMVYVLRAGTLLPTHAGYNLPMSPMGPHGPVYRFPIGYPLFQLPLSTMGPWAMFLMNPALHLIATICFAAILKRRDIQPNFAIFYLFFPSLILYNRSLFSDSFGATSGPAS